MTTQTSAPPRIPGTAKCGCGNASGTSACHEFRMRLVDLRAVLAELPADLPDDAVIAVLHDPVTLPVYLEYPADGVHFYTTGRFAISPATGTPGGFAIDAAKVST
jgi:hypothetical protein